MVEGPLWAFLQIVPARLSELMKGATPAQSQRVMGALMRMVKLDIAGLEAAYSAHTRVGAAIRS